MDKWWERYTKGLDEGRSTRVDCICGAGSTASITARETGFTIHCFRCKLNDYIPYGLRPLSDLPVIRKKEVSFTNKECKLPNDFTQSIPVEYALWFARNGITERTWKAYRCGWSEELKRIVLPVYYGENLTYVQCRAVEPWRKPKYLNNAATTASEVLFRSHDYKRMRTCCITEDIASAMRVGLYLPTVSTLGTVLSVQQAAQIAALYDRCVVWYDDDEAGREGDIKAQRTLRMLGIDCYSICTPLDPKGYSNRQITDIITNKLTDLLRKEGVSLKG